jgi:very-short-patch-repair endonuclease
MRKIKSLKKLSYAPRCKGKKRFFKHDLFSQSEKNFLDQLELIYGVKIERQFALHYRFYDGRWKDVLLEIDGYKWHSKKKAILRDKYKDSIAKKFGFRIFRISLNNIREIPKVLEENKLLLEEIFNDEQKCSLSTSKE